MSPQTSMARALCVSGSLWKTKSVHFAAVLQWGIQNGQQRRHRIRSSTEWQQSPLYRTAILGKTKKQEKNQRWLSLAGESIQRSVEPLVDGICVSIPLRGPTHRCFHSLLEKKREYEGLGHYESYGKEASDNVWRLVNVGPVDYEWEWRNTNGPTITLIADKKTRKNRQKGFVPIFLCHFSRPITPLPFPPPVLVYSWVWMAHREHKRALSHSFLLHVFAKTTLVCGQWRTVDESRPDIFVRRDGAAATRLALDAGTRG